MIDKFNKSTWPSRTWAFTDKNSFLRWTKPKKLSLWLMSNHSTTSNQFKDQWCFLQLTSQELDRKSHIETYQDLQTPPPLLPSMILSMDLKPQECQLLFKRGTSQERALGKRTDLEPPTSREIFQSASWALSWMETTQRSWRFMKEKILRLLFKTLDTSSICQTTPWEDF